MQSDFNHIDDFFRKKEEEASADNSMQDKHWQQMKTMLVSPVPPTAGKIRTLNPKMLWQLVIGVSFVAVIALLVWRFGGNKQNDILVDSPVTVRTKTVIPQTSPSTNNKVTSTPEQTINKQQSIAVKKDRATAANANQISNNVSQPFADLLDRSMTNQPIDTNTNTAQAPVVDPQILFTSFFNQLKKPAQEFVIDNNKDTTIFCKEGTSIFIPAHSLQDENGSLVNGDIRFSVQEFYEMADIIGNKLNTLSDSQQLVTGGMLHLQATVDGKTVSVKKDLNLKVNMPTQKFDPSMQLFYSICQNRNVIYDKLDSIINLKHKYDTAICTGDGSNWTPSGPMQGFFDEKRLVTVIDLLNDPRSIKIKGKKKIAKFILSDNSTMSSDQMKAELQKRYGYMYDEIQVRKGWKPVFVVQGNKLNVNKVKSLEKTDSSNTPNTGAEFASYKNGLVGDSIRMSLPQAIKNNLLNKTQAERLEEQFRKEFEASTGNKKYDDYNKLKNNYSFNVENVGWINCDKFLAYRPNQLTHLIVDAGAEYDQTYFQSFIVFHEFNSVMSGTWQNGRILFTDIPIDKKVSVICVGIKDGKTVYAIKEATTTKLILNGLEFQETNPAAFKEKMKMFGNVQKG